MYSGRASSISILSDGPAFIQHLTGDSGQCLHGLVPPYAQALNPKLSFACGVCVHECDELCSLLSPDNHATRGRSNRGVQEKRYNRKIRQKQPLMLL